MSPTHEKKRRDMKEERTENNNINVDFVFASILEYAVCLIIKNQLRSFYWSSLYVTTTNKK
jgi:hypothetical protein